MKRLASDKLVQKIMGEYYGEFSFGSPEFNPSEVAEQRLALIEYIAKKLSELLHRSIGNDYIATMNETENALFCVAEQNIEALEKLARELGDE